MKTPSIKANKQIVESKATMKVNIKLRKIIVWLLPTGNRLQADRNMVKSNNNFLRTSILEFFSDIS